MSLRKERASLSKALRNPKCGLKCVCPKQSVRVVQHIRTKVVERPVPVPVRVPGPVRTRVATKEVPAPAQRHSTGMPRQPAAPEPAPGPEPEAPVHAVSVGGETVLLRTATPAAEALRLARERAAGQVPVEADYANRRPKSRRGEEFRDAIRHFAKEIGRESNKGRREP